MKRIAQLTTHNTEGFRKQQDLIDRLQHELNGERTLLYEMSVAESKERQN